MHYQFPKISKLDDILPYLEGYDEFILAEKDNYKVLNYVVWKPKTFHIDPENPISGHMRRECRGLIFDNHGKLISRPFHKAFGIDQIEETQLQNLNFKKYHYITEKMDGSMIRPLVFGNEIFLATKMGHLTEVALMAQNLVDSFHEEQKNWIINLFNRGKTPLFEFISPDNQIVIKYNEPKLILLCVRDNLTGFYYMPENCPFEKVKCISMEELNEPTIDYIQKSYKTKNREGDVIRFIDGHMVKVKTDDYVFLHQTKESISSDRKAVIKILEDTIDDILPKLDLDTRQKISKLQNNFWESFFSKLKELKSYKENILDQLDSRKDRVLRIKQDFTNKQDQSALFEFFKDKELNDILFEMCLYLAYNNQRFETLKTWLKFEN